jgi:DNA-binding NtrC family response regulator
VSTDVRPLADVEREYITAVLRAVDGNRRLAAKKLGIGEARFTAGSGSSAGREAA